MLFECIRVKSSQRSLLIGYLVTCMIQHIKHPVLFLHAQPGQGKAVAMEFIKDFLDPSFQGLTTLNERVKDECRLGGRPQLFF